jgi:hypothetical protein
MLYRTLVHRPSTCSVDRIAHSKRMLGTHRAAMTHRCDRSNSRGLYISDDPACRELWGEMLTLMAYLRDHDELNAAWPDCEDFLSRLGSGTTECGCPPR